MAKIVNITATFEIETPFKLPDGCYFRHYSTKNHGSVVKFPGAIYKNYGLTFLIFRTGKCVCVGGKNVESVEKTCEMFAKNLGKLCLAFEIRNLVGNLSLSQSINLPKTASRLQNMYRISYDPELFEAVVVHLTYCTVILFGTGKVNFTGVKTFENIEKGWAVVKSYLQSC